MDSASLVVERAGPVATLVLNRPERRNALDHALRAALAAALDELDDDPDVRVIVVTGADPAFCAGVDLREPAAEPGSEREALPEAVAAPLDRARKPVIAAVNGAAVGGGLELALACDIRLAAETATFALTEARIGSFPGSGGVQRLARLVGPSAAATMVLTGETVDAAGAYRLGLADEILRASDLAERARQLAERIAANAPLSVLAAKQSLRAAAEVPLSAGLALDRSLWASLLATEDRAEGRAAFRERRPAQFRGR